MGVGYEILMIAGKHDNFLTRAISAPGMWVQRLTTKEPTLDMLEVAIVSIKCALRDEFPEYKEFFDNKEWLPKAAPTEEGGETDTEGCDTPAEADTAEAGSTAEAEILDLPEIPLTEAVSGPVVDITNPAGEDGANDA